MSRVKRGVTKRARHKKILKMAKGYRGRAKNCFRIAIEKVEKALRYAYRDRKARKRDFRGLWIQRINAGVREHGMVYSTFINANCQIAPIANLSNQGTFKSPNLVFGSIK